MGYSIRPGTQIMDFWPDDDETTQYIASSYGPTLTDLLQHAKDKWGDDVTLDDIEVTAEKIHTYCIYYDLYDSGDYTDFLVLKYNK